MKYTNVYVIKNGKLASKKVPYINRKLVLAGIRYLEDVDLDSDVTFEEIVYHLYQLLQTKAEGRVN